MSAPTLADALKDPARPVFLFGLTPPREGTSEQVAIEACLKFAQRSAVLATDGFIVYDIQDEEGRTTLERPFPFRKTMDPAWYASLFPKIAGKPCVVYKCVVEQSVEHFNNWLRKAYDEYGHRCFNLVGAPSSNRTYTGATMQQAALSLHGDAATGAAPIVPDAQFGCVCIPERHTKKGNEHSTMVRKSGMGGQWFITQGIYSEAAAVKLLNDYGDDCKARGVVPKKVILTFAPCGRAKTMTFIKWLGMDVPAAVEERIMSAAEPVLESVEILCEILVKVLQATAGSGVPLGINVESLSIFKDEINAAHSLFQRLQMIMLNSSGSPWAVRWFYVPAGRAFVASKVSENNLMALTVPTSTGYAAPPPKTAATVAPKENAEEVKDQASSATVFAAAPVV